MTLTFDCIASAGDPRFAEVMALYAVAFPRHEQREAESQHRILAYPDYHCCALRDGDTFAGLACWWETDGYIYLEHLAVCSELRGRGYGRQAVRQLQGLGKPILLEIDPPVDPVSLRRRDFYLSLGFRVNLHNHRFPPYHFGDDAHPMVLLSLPDLLTEEETEAFTAFIASRVMKDVFPQR